MGSGNRKKLSDVDVKPERFEKNIQFLMDILDQKERSRGSLKLTNIHLEALDFVSLQCDGGKESIAMYRDPVLEKVELFDVAFVDPCA